MAHNVNYSLKCFTLLLAIILSDEMSVSSGGEIFHFTSALRETQRNISGLTHERQSEENSTWEGRQDALTQWNVKDAFFFSLFLRIRLLKSWWCCPLQDTPPTPPLHSSHWHPPPCCEITFRHPRALVPPSMAFFLNLTHYPKRFLLLPPSTLLHTTPHTCLSRQNHFKTRAP